MFLSYAATLMFTFGLIDRIIKISSKIRSYHHFICELLHVFDNVNVKKIKIKNAKLSPFSDYVLHTAFDSQRCLLDCCGLDFYSSSHW